MTEIRRSLKTITQCPVKLLLGKKDIIRCSKCPFIPLIEIREKNNDIIILSTCQNNHKEEKLLKSFIEQIKNQKINSNLCNECQKKENKIPMNYCIKCNLNICDKCKNNHNNSHQLILLRDINSTCPKHLRRFFGFCKTCNYNICTYCLEEHESHNIEQLSKKLIEEEEIIRYKKLIKTAENHLSNIQKFFNTLINELEKTIENLQKNFKLFEEYNLLEIKFAKDIISNYEYECSLKNYNYQIIMNVRNNLKFSFTEIPKSENTFIKAFKFQEYIKNNLSHILYIRSNQIKINNIQNVIATLICSFENNNDEQKLYCMKLKDSIKFPGNIGYEIKSVKEQNFSIKLVIGDKVFFLQNEKNFSDSMMNKTLENLYQILNQVRR